jgi:Xaa-Pro dipeptidase
MDNDRVHRVDDELLSRLFADHVRVLESGYASALAATGYDAVVLHSGSPKKRTDFDDQYWPLRPTPHFQHWAPVSDPECAVVVVPGKRTKLVWMKDTSFWERPASPEAEPFRDELDVVEATSLDSAKGEIVAALGGASAAFIGEDRGRAAAWGFDASRVVPVELVRQLDQLRVTKTSYEILCLEEANRRAAFGHDALAHAFAAGDATELELHLLYLRVTGQDDPETPYKNIVALGENAATLHHVRYGKSTTRSGAAQSLLLDAGATYLGYASDITRTYVKGTSAAASAFGELIAGVEELQGRLCAEIAVGKKYEDLHDLAHREIAGALRAVGVVTASAQEAVATGVTRAFFPHGLGHSLGLQTHDVGCAQIKPRADNPFLRNTTVIAQGQTFTIEPGIYFIEGLLAPLRAGPHARGVDWDLVNELAVMGGVRIEDDILVTGGERVIRNLTRECLP